MDRINNCNIYADFKTYIYKPSIEFTIFPQVYFKSKPSLQQSAGGRRVKSGPRNLISENKNLPKILYTNRTLIRFECALMTF